MRTLITERLARLSAFGSPKAEAGLREAAVLLPLFERPRGLTVLFAQRTWHLHHHAGQIGLPGGGIEPGDAGPVEAALRETEEEIGIPRDRIEVVGRLESLATLTGFRITPVVGFVAPGVEIKLDPFEVEHVFEVPLDFVLDPRNREVQKRRFRNTEVSYYVINYDGRIIWGVTAQILVDFANTLASSEENIPPP